MVLPSECRHTATLFRDRHARTQAARLRDPEPPRRAASGSRHRRTRGADLPDHLLRVPGFRTRRGAVQSRARRAHLHPDFKSDDGGAGRAAGRAGKRRRRDLHRERHGGAASGDRHAAQCRRPYRRLRLALWRHHQPAGAYAAALRHHHHICKTARSGCIPFGDPAQYPPRDRRDHRQSRPRSAGYSEGRRHRA